MASSCSCGEPILWAKTHGTAMADGQQQKEGKPMPFDAEPIARAGDEPPESKLGVYALIDGRAVPVTSPQAEGHDLYITHFATCPEAAVHRRRR